MENEKEQVQLPENAFRELKEGEDYVRLDKLVLDGLRTKQGICIGTAFQGNGYGKEIVALLLKLVFEELGAEDCRYGYFRENEKSKKVAEFFGFRYDSTYELTRPWDGCVKTIESCILTKEEYLKNKKHRMVIRGVQK